MKAIWRAAPAPLAGIAISAALLADTRGLDQVVPGDQLGPGFWPRLVLSGLVVACLARLVTTARPVSVAGAGDRDGAGPPPIDWPRLSGAIALIILYVLAAPVIGFAVATAAFSAAFMWVCGARSAGAIAVTALVGTVALLYLFVKAVYLPLPKGDGVFEAVTLALYRALHIF
jgi:putative tricarboxylic transport membrane protein